MRPVLRRRIALTTILVGGMIIALPAQQSAPPQFRASTELTRLELTVLDKKTRKPIKGLTAADFVIKVNGDIQPVAALAEVDSTSISNASGVVFKEAARDVASNGGPQPRLFVIVMNDAVGQNDPFDRRTGKAIAHGIIEGLGQGDMAAVVFTRDNRNAQDFTTDRTLLRQAVERFNPMYTAGIRPLSVVRRAQMFLSKTPGYRRAIVFISPLFTPSGAVSDPYMDADAFGIDEDAEAADRQMHAITTGGQIAHVPIYPYSTHGLHAPTAAGLRSGMPWREATEFDIALRRIAATTGGRAAVSDNAPAQLVPQMFEELSSYYAIGFRALYPLDGKLRWLDVQVKHPDALVMPSGVAIATTKSLASDGTTPSPMTGRASGLSEALGAPVPTGAVALRMSSLPFSVEGRREQALLLTLGLPPVASGVREQFRVRLLVFDGEGRREIMSQTQDVTVIGGATDGARGTEVAMRLAQRPGRYNLRVVAERLGTKEFGSIHATVTIPGFTTETLSLSGVAIGLAEGRPVAGREAFSDLLPFAPTAVRSFAATDHVGALLRVHQRSDRPAHPVLLQTEIIDGGGGVARSVARTIAASEFTSGGVEHRYDLPLSSLEAGDYLLRFVATTGNSRVQRDVRFSVGR